uniref:Uncharacterized protein n=1 Tax=Oryza barthii TaxID=65489 RepID=A0A0D3GFU9_9ORYZ
MDGKRIGTGCLFPCHEQSMRKPLRKGKLPFVLVVGGRSIGEEQPQLYLHCNQMIRIGEWRLQVTTNQFDEEACAAYSVECSRVTPCSGHRAMARGRCPSMEGGGGDDGNGDG